MATLFEKTNGKYVTLTDSEKNGLLQDIVELLKKATLTDAQEITIISGETIYFKSNGVLEPMLDLKVWTDDTFNYFLEHLAMERLPHIAPSEKNELYSEFFDEMVDNNDYFKDFSVKVKEKTLRIHAVSIYNGAGVKRKFNYCFTIRVVPNDIPEYKDLNLPKLFEKTTTLTSGLVLISGHTGSGKALASDTLLPSPKGFVQIGNLKVGDTVFDRLGKPTNVTGVYPQGLHDTYQVLFEDGRTSRCNLEHLWTYVGNDGVLYTKTLKEMLAEGVREVIDGDTKFRFNVPLNGKVEYPTKKLEIAPKALGENILKNPNKFIEIPEDYLTGDIEQREELFHTILKDETSVFKTDNTHLLLNIRELGFSLGYVMNVQENPTGDSIEYSIAYIAYKETLKIVAIEQEKEMTEHVCIKVDNPEELFLTEDYIVTHNTTTIASLVNAINRNPSLRRSILTIEDPIEFVYKSSQAIILQRGIGINTPSYTIATQNALRENVDTVVIGELREAEAMDNAIRLAEMGKLVFATVHCNSPADAIDRIVAEFPGDLQDSVRARLFESVVGVLHQNLELVLNETTGKEEQIPSASGFLIQNSNQKSEFRRNQTRAGVYEIVNTKPWGFSYRESYEELVSRGVIKDTPENKSKLVPM